MASPDDARAPDPAQAATTPAGVPGQPGAPPLLPGAVVAGRYRIVRMLGEGGMGQVYEAEDSELGESVALKTLRSEAAGDERAVARFKREIQLARKVTHPHVCRIFDVGTHVAENGGSLTFLTMELLRGENLSDRLRRMGPLVEADALPIARQMAGALDAAHQAGVVHRDFKSSNVLLCDGPIGLRAVVTDFGLARAAAGEGGPPQSRTLTQLGEVVGSPPYMAPEQLASGEITGRTDVYALGVVLFEMVTGTWPFMGDTPLATALKRLSEPPPSPRLHAKALSLRWEATILRCLERQPGRRFASAGEAVRGLFPGGHPRRRRWPLVLGLCVLAGLVGGGASWLIKRSSPLPVRSAAVADLARTTGSRRSVAILGFKNLSGQPDAAWLSTALAEMLTTELAAGERLRVCAGEQVARAKADLSLASTETLAVDTLGQLHRKLGVDYVILGSYLVTGDPGHASGRLRLDLRLQEIKSGELVASLVESGATTELSEIVGRVTRAVRERLGAGALTPTEVGALRASLPQSPLSARHYAEGLDGLRHFEYRAAREHLERAVAADPSFALAHSALAEALARLGYQDRARREGQRALELARRLGREENLLVEARYYEITDESAKALQSYRTLWKFFPDNVDYGVELARLEAESTNSKDALATVQALRALPAPLSEDPRIDLAEADAALWTDTPRARAAAARAISRGSALGARLVVAQGEIVESRTLQMLGETDAATRAREEASRILAQIGDPGRLARELDRAASLLEVRGDAKAARRVRDEALAAWRKLGEPRVLAHALSRLAEDERDSRDAPAARSHFREALTLARTADDQAGAAGIELQLAQLALDEGDSQGGLAQIDQAVATYRRLGEPESLADGLVRAAGILDGHNLFARANATAEEAVAVRRTVGEAFATSNALFLAANVAWQVGELARARAHLEEAAQLASSIGNQVFVAIYTGLLAHVIREQGDLQAARATTARAIEMARRQGMSAEQAALIAGSIGRLELDEGHPAAAEALARSAAEGLARQKLPMVGEASVLRVLALALLAQDKIEEARKVAARIQSLATQTRGPTAGALDREHRVEALLLASSHKPADCQAALGMLERDQSWLHQIGLIQYELEVRLAHGQIQRSCGQVDQARSELSALARDATSRGFGGIAHRARAEGASE
jgi:serine/threonine protein kinase/tetratricopeptide (TPR) repeat protein